MDHLMEQVVERSNCLAALRRVRRNRGSPGVDGMTVDELSPWLKEHWPRIREALLAGTYQPQPVRRHEIPKSGGGVRQLGIPTVLDRFIQQTILQVLGPPFDAGFSEHSYGFRPGRRAHDAIRAAQRYIKDGKTWVVDVDLERFFDRVNHDVLMARLAQRIADRRLLGLIRRFLEAGVMAGGVVVERHEGTPQGGPLSPLLANVLLDEVDRELERRGHAFARYADDCNVYVRSKRAGDRVMSQLRRLYGRLRLRVNEAKSAVGRPWDRTFLGVTFWCVNGVRCRVSKDAMKRAKDRIRELTNRHRGMKLETIIAELRSYLLGWKQYFAIAEVRRPLRDLDEWIRARLRLYMLKQWKRGTTAYRRLIALGVDVGAAIHTARHLRRWWHTAHSPGAHQALSNAELTQRGLPSLAA